MGTHGTPTSALVPRRVIRALCVRPGTGRRLRVRLMRPRQQLDAAGRHLNTKGGRHGTASASEQSE